jgi:hypothetical protein
MIFASINQRKLASKTFAPPFLQRRLYERGIRRSLNQLGEFVGAPGSPEPFFHEDPFGRPYALWPINTRLAGTIYMKVERKNYCNDRSFVVITDTGRFYRAWCETSINHSFKSLSCAPVLKEIPLDYKFNRADTPLRKSARHNPVPLAEIAIFRQMGDPKIRFGDGCTRTMWLIYQRASFLPFMTHDLESAEMLHAMAGIGPKPVSLEQLFSLQPAC